MNAAESVLPIYAGIITDSLRLQFAGVFVCPATETVFGIEKQITGCFAAAGKQSALSSMLQMKAVKFLQIDIRQNIYIMNQERFIGMFEETARFLDSSTRIEQEIPFVGDMDGDTEIPVGTKEVYNLFAEMMDIHNLFGKTRRFQF